MVSPDKLHWYVIELLSELRIIFSPFQTGPQIFNVVLNIVRPLLTQHTQKAIRLYSYDKEEWKREVLKVFPADQITPEFGGTRKIKTKV